MPTVLLTVSAIDRATSVLRQVQESLARMDGALATQVSQTDRVALALARYQRAVEQTTRADAERQRLLGLAGATTDQLTRATDALTAAELRQAAAGQQVMARMNEQHATAKRLSDEMGAFAKNFLLYGTGYQAGFALLGAAQQSIQNNVGLSTLVGQTAAQTPQPGLDPATYMKQLEAYARKTAGTGQWQYNAQQVLQGAYNFVSVGGYSLPEAEALNQYALGLSQIGGAQDTTTASTAMMAMLQGFGRGTNVNQTARGYANLLQVAANAGAYTVPQIAQTLPRANLFGLHQQGFDPRFIMAAFTAASTSGVDPAQTAQDMAALGSVLLKPTASQIGWARALHMQIGPGAFAQAGGAMGWFTELQQHLSRTSAPRQQLALAGLFGREDAARLIDEVFAGTGTTSMASLYRQMQTAGQGQGAYGTALATEGKTPGQHLANSMNQLSTAFDNLTNKSVPVLAAAIVTATGGLHALATWGTKTQSNPAGGTPWDTLVNLLTPGGAGFMNLQKAQDMAARGQRSTGAGAATGTWFDQQVANLERVQNALGAFLGHVATTGTYGIPPSRPDARLPSVSSATSLQAFAGIPPTFVTPATAGVPGFGTVLPFAAPHLQTLVGHAAAAASAAQANVLPNQIDATIAARVGMTGRGGANAPTPEMQRWANNITAGILQGWDPNRLQSALGLYTQAVHANAGLTGSQQLADIARETKLVAGHLAGVKGAAALAPPFAQLQPGMGGLEAGFQNTVVRFGAGADPQTQEIRRLQAELTRANNKITGLLQQIHDLLAMQGRRPTATPQIMAGTGTDRLPHR